MDIIAQYFNAAVGMYGTLGLGLMGALIVLFAIQMRYYLGLFRRLPSFRIGGRRDSRDGAGSISVVVVMGDDYLWVENSLPALLAQDYEPFEVIVVYVGNNGEFAETLEAVSVSEPRFRVSRVKQHPLFPISNKMAINIGIKAARHDNIVITTPDAHPASHRWLSLMARGFAKGEIVIGYCGVEPSRGLADKLIRSSRMFSSLLYLTAAIRRKPYRGTIHNMGFARELYFRHKGFGHLNMNLGEDDLFMQQIVTRDNYTIVVHPKATVRQTKWGGLGWWLGECRLRNHAYPFYPFRVRWYIGLEAGSRLLFFVAAAAAAVLMPFEVRVGVGGVAALRFAAVMLQMRRVARRLGERRLVPLYFLNDLFEPLFGIGVVVSRMVRPIREVWR
ncbi:MAG: glycosyltransferase [Alistipes sp.]|jgi:cellulose synthase/poly-beta-1,6-N-acetylglucosamine synthase-like glycosyltransferase|nr:glycosyltransferase [Alistipes sp.]